MTIATRLKTCLDSIKQAHKAAEGAGGVPKPVPQLLAVSKGQPAFKITEALEAGQRLFGENRVQEAVAKWRELREKYPDIELHLVGPLQSNKAAVSVAVFDVIQTLDRPKIAEALKAEETRQNRHLRYFIQVNIGEEPQKSGIAPQKLPEFHRFCRATGLNVIGLMCIPPLNEPPTPYFTRLRQLAVEEGLSELSMGMSGDFKEAIACGATYIRLGTAVFGERG